MLGLMRTQCIRSRSNTPDLIKYTATLIRNSVYNEDVDILSDIGESEDMQIN